MTHIFRFICVFLLEISMNFVSFPISYVVKKKIERNDIRSTKIFGWLKFRTHILSDSYESVQTFSTFVNLNTSDDLVSPTRHQPFLDISAFLTINFCVMNMSIFSWTNVFYVFVYLCMMLCVMQWDYLLLGYKRRWDPSLGRM